MPRALLTPVTCSNMSTAVMTFSTANMIKLTTAGAYVKTTGLNAGRLLFVISLNSSKMSSAGKVIIRAGSTAGKSDFEPGTYTTGRDLNITVSAISTGDQKGVSKKFFVIRETARFKDTNGYIKIDVSSKISSIRNGATSKGSKMGVIYLAR